MTSEQLARIKVGDHVEIGDEQGIVKQTAPTWFMVTWDGGGPEIFNRTLSIVRAMELHA